MNQWFGQLSLLVRDYDEAIQYYTQILVFELLEDTPHSETKRWVRVCHYRKYTSRGVEFLREPSQESYGTVSVFRDLYGNLWDLIEPVKK